MHRQVPERWLLAHGIGLQTPLRPNMKDDRDPEFVRTLTSARQPGEAVIWQLRERFSIEKVCAGELWHLAARRARKLLSHTVAVFISSPHGRGALQSDGLVAAA